MQLTSLLAAGGLAASATAIMLPPPDFSDDDVVTTLPVPTDVDFDITQIADNRILDVDCTDCPVALGGDPTLMTTGVPSSLKLEFSVEPASDGADRLLLNGYEMYPNADPFSGSLTAAVKAVDDEESQAATAQPLGFGMGSRPITSEDGMDLIMVELQIIEVGSVFVSSVPDIQVKLLKTPTGKLVIADLDTVPSGTSQKNPMDKQEECTTFLCKWKAVMMQKFNALRRPHGCGRRPAHLTGMHKGGFRPHHHHEHAHRFLHVFRMIATHILLPITIGVMAGITASIIGMMVGTLITFLWRTFVRRPDASGHHASGRCHKAAQSDAAVDCEKAGLMEHQEEAEAPPAYVESGLVVVNEEKPEDEA
ncbi:hypothetical protein GGR56DRAFT_674408 [Xylariaceae sp. FL0804]|nr:hypothetical protein GGR56DRAFT_674408 [Xylariaceae sp. FL0804]